MHQTTIRFGDELWQTMEAAASAHGVPVAQFVREAVVARLLDDADVETYVELSRTDRRRAGLMRQQQRAQRQAAREQPAVSWLTEEKRSRTERA